MKKALKSMAIFAAGVAALAAVPASASQVWVYYGGYGEVVGYRVICESGAVYEEGYQSTSYQYYQGDPC